MPRLLLVDDNPSIHKIAETLLAGTDVALVCAASGAEAIATLEKGEPFDVAMLDISMMGMDGWELLAHLRGQEATARMPVGMMAGVLDVVDPERLRLAPIQGFFKKPVELRDLAERVKLLLETPVGVPAPPEPAEAESPAEKPAPEEPVAEEPIFEEANVAEPIVEEVIGEEVLGEEAIVAEPIVEEPAEATDIPGPQSPSPYGTIPGFRALERSEPVEAPAAAADDLLLLGPEDLYPGEDTARSLESPAAQPEPAELLEDSLDLEELDLDSLRSLTQPQADPQAETADAPAEERMEDFNLMDALAEPSPIPEPQPAVEVITSVPDFSAEDTLIVPPPAPVPDPEAAAEALPDLFPAEPVSLPEAGAPAPAETEDFLDWSEDSDTMLEALPAALDEAVPPALDLDVDLDKDEAPTEKAITLSDILDPGPPMAAPIAEVLPDAPVSPAQPEEDLQIELITEVLLADEMPPLPAVASPQPAASALAEPPAPRAEPVPLAPLPETAAAPAGPEGPDPLAALLADPVLMDRLTQAVVSRLGDQALREIAWEIMPELAERLHRN